MYKVTKFPHGTFSWADTSSMDGAAAKQFYAELMGWDIEETPMGDGEFYSMFKKDGSYTAALSQINEEQAASGMPSMWTSYVTVDDIDSLTSKVTELGGTVVMEPFDVLESGRMMVLIGPTGEGLALWQPKNHIGAGVVNDVGALTWNELMTTDPQKAQDFYGGLLGWTFDKSEHMEYYTIKNNGRPNGGIFPTPEGMEAPPNWTVYFAVADIEKTVAKATELGGTVIMPATEAQGVGTFATLADPAGAVFAVITYLEGGDPWEE